MDLGVSATCFEFVFFLSKSQKIKPPPMERALLVGKTLVLSRCRLLCRQDRKCAAVLQTDVERDS